ncbi:MAG: signal peptidase II, partial [bacterium]
AAVIVSIACVWVIQTAPEKQVRLTAALILGGGLGNMIDRIFLTTGVVDFLDMGIYSYRWPAFNIADMMLCVGMLVFVVHVILDEADLDGFELFSVQTDTNSG